MLSTPAVRKSWWQFVRANRIFFFIATLVAIGLRIFFLVKFRHISDDSLMYGDIAKNWMQHGVFGQSFPDGPHPTFIRLPGYPFFLVLVWSISGIEHYTAVLITQVVIDVLTCFVVADLARRIASDRAAQIAFVLTALCPFFANYAAVALTETLELFFTALAFDLAVAALDAPSRKSNWIGCGLAVGAGILLRPDGGMLLGAVGLFLLYRLIRSDNSGRALVTGGLLVAIFALTPLIPWTIRNWRTLHAFQPLAPFNANNPDEFVARGFHKWVRTWILDYASVEDIWFNMDAGNGGDVDLDNVPRRAFDNPQQLQRSIALFQQYDDANNNISPELDAAFADLARDRIREHPLRYYLELPILRALDLWFRPRTEMLPIDPHWWRYWDDPHDFVKAAALGLINLLYVIAAIFALVRHRVRYAALFLIFFVVRTAFLSWMPNPEPRYMLECYPALLAIAAAAWSTSEDKVMLKRT
jgi:4-amino-4-deoxy-L-arabinose transferase-like glycosyltransferase